MSLKSGLNDVATERQLEILGFIASKIRAGRPPSYREIGLHFAIRSPNGVQNHVLALEKKGYLKVNHGSRGLALTARAGQEEDPRQAVVDAAIEWVGWNGKGPAMGYGERLKEAVKRYQKAVGA